MTKVRVLMSTYNGEKYLKEQIDSVVHQRDVEISLYIRDDGSKDLTCQILEKFCAAHSNIKVFTEQNIGCIGSFFRLMQMAYDKEVEYYAFCDQDDVWDEDKLAIAVKKLSEYDSDKMNMYCSNLWVTDEMLNLIREMYSPQTSPDKVGALVENIATGCTVVINKASMEFILSMPLPQYPIMHDWWLYKLCAFLGNVYFDTAPHIKYRQHTQNVLGAKKKSALKKALNFVSSVFESNNSHYRLESAEEFLNTYRNLLSEQNVQLIEILTEYKQSVSKRLRLFFSNTIKMKNRSSNIRFKIRVLFGLV